MNPIEWRDWEESAFEEARRLNRPVLLVLTASWCRFSHDLLNHTFTDERVIEEVNRSFVPVHVDKDRRPDIDERYNMGGWPTVAFIDAEGEAITGGTDFEPKELGEVLQRFAQHFSSSREVIREKIKNLIDDEIAAQRQREERTGTLSQGIVTSVLASIVESWDPDYGGFGKGQKFPHPESLDFALLEYARSGDEKVGQVVEKTLASMAERGLFDTVGGGFYRFCGTRDWREPNTEKLLETNAGLLRNYLEASQVFARADFRRVAERVVDYILGVLYDDGKLYGSQDGDAAYYSLSEADREKHQAPEIDRTVYVNQAAIGISSLFKAGAVLERPDVTEKALTALRFLLDNCYSEGRGMYHYFDETRHMLGLLTDQIYTARALVHAIQYTGDNQFLPILEDLIATIVRKQSATHGGFYDIPEENASFGALRRRNKSILENAVMAEVLIRSYYLTLNGERLEQAQRTLEAFAEDYQAYGYVTAGYGRAVDLYFEEPLHIVVVGKQNDPVRTAMITKATATYVPSKVIAALDPDEDKERLAATSLQPQDFTVAYVCLRKQSLAEVRDPDSLPEIMSKAAEPASE